MMAMWKTKSLGDVCQVIGGGTPSKDKADYYSGDIHWATVRDMRSDVITETEFKITEAAVKSSATNIIPGGNVVIATRVGLGKVCILGQDTAINQDLRGIVPIDSQTLAVRFLYWWLKSISDLIVAEGTGATVQGVKLPFVKSLKIPVPSISEQKRIVAILDEAFDGIATARANTEKNLQNARALFESHLQSVFTLRGEGWTEWLFEDLIESNLIGLTKSSREQGEDKAFPYVKMNNITHDNRFDSARLTFVDCTEEELMKFSLRNGDFLFNTRNSYELVGKSCIYESDLGDSVLFNNNIMRVRFKKQFHARFILFAFSAMEVSEKLNAMKSGTTNVSAIYFKDLRALAIPAPSIEAQKAIAASLVALGAETKRLEALYKRKLAALDELKKSLLHKAFSGQL